MLRNVQVHIMLIVIIFVKNVVVILLLVLYHLLAISSIHKLLAIVYSLLCSLIGILILMLWCFSGMLGLEQGQGLLNRVIIQCLLVPQGCLDLGWEIAHHLTNKVYLYPLNQELSLISLVLAYPLFLLVLLSLSPQALLLLSNSKGKLQIVKLIFWVGYW